MTRQELRAFLQTWYCGCGRPQDASLFLLTILHLIPLYEKDHRQTWNIRVQNNPGLNFFLLYTLNHFGLLEHGSSVEGSWLTGKGEAVMKALEVECRLDSFNTLHGDGPYCIHGYDITDNPHEC